MPDPHLDGKIGIRQEKGEKQGQVGRGGGVRQQVPLLYVLRMGHLL